MLLIASVAAPGLGELFTSIAHMQAALYAERDIAEEIREYIRVEEEKLNKLKRYFFVHFTLLSSTFTINFIIYKTMVLNILIRTLFYRDCPVVDSEGVLISETKLFHFHGIFKKNEIKSAKQTPHTFIHMNRVQPPFQNLWIHDCGPRTNK